MEKTSIGMLWKAFVKSSNESHEILPEKKNYDLSFQGEEARLAYEEIIKQEGEIVTTKKPTSIRLKSSNAQSILHTKSLLDTVQPKKTHSAENIVIKVTINAILKAVEQKDLKFLQKHITPENVNVSDDFGWTPLMSAAYCGHLEVIEFLLQLGANRRIKEKSGLTAAQLALKRNHLNIVALLRKKHDFTNIKTQTDKLEITEISKNCKESACNDEDSVKDKLQENTNFYCDICKRNFRETTVKKHEASTLHIFNTKPKLPNAIYGISKQNKGYQMLLNTGWDEEGGLGPSGKGIKYPIKTMLKMDRKGLGQPGEVESRITHFMPGDTNAIKNVRIYKQKPLKKRDREKLLNREARKERALRIALS
uniref:G patch domain and ankyrin repeat-containing protein 1 homolog n=1 Tax=Vespula vulgaris TaxID=7454 RepID=UPI00223BEF84|nr:G patch domain and ankyrin repeat-containing protein 1 homolog [Vespula vulgaris]